MTINSINNAILVNQEFEHIDSDKIDPVEAMNQVQAVSLNEKTEVRVDGNFDQMTENQVVKLQEKLKIETDGIVTEQVVQKMEGLLDKLNMKNEYKFDKIKQQMKVQDSHASESINL